MSAVATCVRYKCDKKPLTDTFVRLNILAKEGMDELSFSNLNPGTQWWVYAIVPTSPLSHVIGPSVRPRACKYLIILDVMLIKLAEKCSARHDKIGKIVHAFIKVGRKMYDIFFCLLKWKHVEYFNEIWYVKYLTVRETYARPLNASTFWAGRVENWPGQVEFCIEHIRDICFRASAPEI